MRRTSCESLGDIIDLAASRVRPMAKSDCKMPSWKSWLIRSRSSSAARSSRSRCGMLLPCASAPRYRAPAPASRASRRRRWESPSRPRRLVTRQAAHTAHPTKEPAARFPSTRGCGLSPRCETQGRSVPTPAYRSAGHVRRFENPLHLLIDVGESAALIHKDADRSIVHQGPVAFFALAQ